MHEHEHEHPTRAHTHAHRAGWHGHGDARTDGLPRRKLGRLVLVVEAERRSTNLDGRWPTRVVGRRRIDNGQTPHGNLEYKLVTASVAPDVSYRVVAYPRGRILGHGMTYEQASEYIGSYSLRYGLIRE